MTYFGIPDIHFITRLNEHLLASDSAALLNGIVLGTPIDRNSLLYKELKEAGLIHIAVLSGMNITLVSNMVLQLLRFLPKKVAISAAVIVVILFVLYVGASAPLVRAAIMGIIGLLAVVTGNKSYSLYSLCISVVIIGISKPEWLTSLSFQLSVAATLGIILFVPTDVSIKNKWIRFIYLELLTSLSAMSLAAPLIFLHFRTLSLASPMSTLLISWLIGPITFIGLLAIILYTPLEYLSTTLITLLQYPVAYILFISEKISSLSILYLRF